MRRKYGEEPYIGIPVEDSNYENLKYDFILITQTTSGESLSPPGMNQGASQIIHHGYNLYLFDSDEHKVDIIDYEDSEEILEESLGYTLGLDVGSLEDDLDGLRENRALSESVSYEQFNPPLNNGKVQQSLEEFKNRRLFGEI